MSISGAFSIYGGLKILIIVCGERFGYVFLGGFFTACGLSVGSSSRCIAMRCFVYRFIIFVDKLKVIY